MFNHYPHIITLALSNLIPAFKLNDMKNSLMLLLLLLSAAGFSQIRTNKNKAVFLADISWINAQKILTPDAVVVIPLGAGSKEHGPHLPLSTDYLQAEEFTRKLALKRKVIIAPTMNYGFYPAFIEYPGSTSLSFSTSVQNIVQTVKTLAHYGPKRFYIINVGVSTTDAIVVAEQILADEGILLFHSSYERSNFIKALDPYKTKTFGTHADERETSNILSFRPDLVDMTRAVNDSSAKGKRGLLSPIPVKGAIFNSSGIIGYAKLATKEKGIGLMNAYVNEITKEIDSISVCALPKAKDRTVEYKLYEGTYIDTVSTKLIISRQNNALTFIWNGRDERNFYPMTRSTDDYFTSLPFDILFIKNEKGEVTKAWCNRYGKSFWVKKVD